MRGFDGWNERRWSYEPPLTPPQVNLAIFMGTSHRLELGRLAYSQVFFYIRIYGSGLGPFIIWLGPKKCFGSYFFSTYHTHIS